MAQVTNSQLQQMIQALTDRQNKNEGRLDRIEERMKTYEEQAKDNYIILRRVEDIVKGYERAISKLANLLKYVLGILMLSLGSILAYWAMGLLHIRP